MHSLKNGSPSGLSKLQDRFVSRKISKHACRIVPPLIMAGLAGDAGSSRHWSGLAKERTGRAEGDTASSVRNDTANPPCCVADDTANVMRLRFFIKEVLWVRKFVS